MNTMDTQGVTALFSLISIGILWGLALLWNRYRVDSVRQDLFEIRDLLFSIAMKHPFLFQHPAYIRLRQSINVCIRFAHKFSTTRLVVTLRVRKSLPPDTWPETLVGLPDEIQNELLKVQKMLHFRMGCYLLHLSMRVAWCLLDRAKQISSAAATRAKREISEKVEMLEAQAAEEYEMETRSAYAYAAAAGH